MRTAKGYEECFLHFRRRWEQRVLSKFPDMGRMDDARFETLRDCIRADVGAGTINVMYEESGSRVHYLVRLHGRETHVVFNRKIGWPVTVISIKDAPFSPVFYGGVGKAPAGAPVARHRVIAVSGWHQGDLREVWWDAKRTECALTNIVASKANDYGYFMLIVEPGREGEVADFLAVLDERNFAGGPCSVMWADTTISEPETRNLNGQNGDTNGSPSSIPV